MGLHFHLCSCQSGDGHEDVQIAQANVAAPVGCSDDAACGVAGKEPFTSD